MQGYPELFGTKAQVDCFVVIGMLTTHSRVIPSLGAIYCKVSCAQNSVRTYLRALANGGWVTFVRRAGGDKREIGLRIEPPMVSVLEEYYARLAAIKPHPPEVMLPLDEGLVKVDPDRITA